MDLRVSVAPKLFAKILDYLEFPEIIKIIHQYLYGKYTILPYITTIYTPLITINPYNLTRCCSVTRLSMPNSNYLNDNMLMMLPNIRSLTIHVGSFLTSEVFDFLPNLRQLEILSSNNWELDTLINSNSVKYLQKLEMLRLNNKILTNQDCSYLSSLKVLIIDHSVLTPEILNILPSLEICVINGILIKYRSSKQNLMILCRLSRLRSVKIYGLTELIGFRLR